MDDIEWEDGSIPTSDRADSYSGHGGDEITLEFDNSPASTQRKRARRASVEEKEISRNVHKAHLLCLLAHGMIVDKACDDPFIQASLLSRLPSNLLKTLETSGETLDSLSSLFKWLHDNFSVISHGDDEQRSFLSSLTSALEKGEGSQEEVAALSVSLSRALNLDARHVSVLDVASIKPNLTHSRSLEGVFATPTMMVRKQHVRDDDAPMKTACPPEEKKPIRKGDLEFEMQMEMSVTATAYGRVPAKSGLRSEGYPSTAVGSKKVGPPLHWAEVFCAGEGRWVHADAVNSVIDGEQNVQATLTACGSFLRYAVAFAGRGAKDVTRRYCREWYRISPHRVSPDWWDAVTTPLVAREDMDLDTRALAEPLPTNQQAYRNHPLYAIERWLTSREVLHPKLPVLGFCSGHAVYPRSSVKPVKTETNWLRQAMQVKTGEAPAKVLTKPNADDPARRFFLYGSWQVEPLLIPPAVDGIVPKNEWGRVDVWCEKCLPPGTTHLRLARAVSAARRLEIDFAPAMVGFESRKGRSFPLYDGIVVCSEFRDLIIEACDEAEATEEIAQRARVEGEALSRWYQLVSSMATRQRLNRHYLNDPTAPSPVGISPLDQHEHEYLAVDPSFDSDSTRVKRCRCGVSIRTEEF